MATFMWDFSKQEPIKKNSETEDPKISNSEKSIFHFGPMYDRNGYSSYKGGYLCQVRTCSHQGKYSYFFGEVSKKVYRVAHGLLLFPRKKLAAHEGVPISKFLRAASVCSYSCAFVRFKEIYNPKDYQEIPEFSRFETWVKYI